MHTGPHGLNQKADDMDCLPGCLWHHQEGPDALDKIGPERFSRIFDLNIPKRVRYFNELWDQLQTRSF
jgi:hypothetical protein